MTTPSDPTSNDPNANTARRGTRPQPRDTVMLSDVPEPDSFASAAAATSPAPQAQLHLSSAALAALGQRYDILGEAGCGSMGQVFKARDRETGETVALKLLKPEIASDQAMMDRFKNELLFARKITHKNVCRVHEFNRLGGVAYTSMEFVEGESLRSVLHRFGGLPLRKAIDLTQQICSGLKEAHAQGIVHRDLKPENVMIDSRGNVKIMDFGIARSMESLTRTTGAMVGTPAYMAPEQVAGKPVDYRTDIYSLGLILYEIFTGTPAFTADNAVAVAMKQLREAPVRPHELEPSIPVPVERAILKALEKQPDKRFQSVAELEKVFVSALAAGAVVRGAHSTGGRATEDALSVEPTVGSGPSAATLRIAPAEAKPSRARRIALISAAIVAVLYGLAFAGWARKAKLADQLPPPKSAPVPGLPDFAFSEPAAPVSAPAVASPNTTTVADAPAGSTDSPPGDSAAAPVLRDSPEKAASLEAPPPSAQPASPATNSIAPGPQAAARLSPNVTGANSVPAEVQQHAENAFKENQPAPLADRPSGAASQPLGSVLPGNGASYVWVNRFELEDRAQNAARKLQGFGLKSVVLSRRDPNGQAFYVVFLGPVAPAQIPSMIDWLRTQGFANPREVKPQQLFGRGRGGGGPQNGAPNNVSQGSSQ